MDADGFLCQQDTVADINGHACSSCLVRAAVPQEAATDVEPLLDDSAPGLITLVEPTYVVGAPISGGPCPLCGTFFAWQKMTAVVCPHCGTRCRTGPATRAPIYIYIAFIAGSLIAASILLQLNNFRIAGFTFMLNSAVMLVLIAVNFAYAHMFDRLPLVEGHDLTPDETARVAHTQNDLNI